MTGALRVLGHVSSRIVRLSWLLSGNAAISASFGIAALLFPGPLYDSFGGSSDVGGQFVVRLFGATLFGEALLRFFLRGVAPGPSRDVVTSAALGEYALATVATLEAQLGGVTNDTGWVLVAVSLLFAIGYAWFRFPGRASS